MKIELSEMFEPITITIQSMAELYAVVSLLKRAMEDEYSVYGDTRNIYSEMLISLNGCMKS